jgi:hypothetical protein
MVLSALGQAKSVLQTGNFFIFFTKLKGIGLELLQRICEILLLFVLINVPVLKVFAFLTLR